MAKAGIDCEEMWEEYYVCVGASSVCVCVHACACV